MCPHTIHLIHDDGRIDRVPTSTLGACRAETAEVKDGDVNGFPVMKITYKDINGLPPPRMGVVYITSMLVAQRVKRPDVLSPGEMVRDAEGKIVGCKSLARHT